MNLVGQTIEYLKVIELLGEGGMGRVYLAFDDRLHRQVVVKSIRADRSDIHSYPRLLREARALSRLDHQHICRIFDYLKSGSKNLLVLEYIRGSDLSHALKKGMSLPAKLRVVEQIAEALVYAHAQSVIHRDLKLKNVMVTDDGDVKVVDFGLAVLNEEPWEARSPDELSPSDGIDSHLEVARVTQDGAVVGTPGSLSPEQAKGEPVTAATDMYCFGLLIQELVTEKPARDRNATQYELIEEAKRGLSNPVTGVDRELANLIRQLKSVEPAQRPTAAETLRAVRRIRNRGVRRLRWGLGLVATVLVCFAAGKYTYDLGRERSAAMAAKVEAQEVTEFLVGLFEVSDPGEPLGNRITAREILDEGAQKIQSELNAHPAVQIRLLMTMGRVYQNMGLYQTALSMYEAAASGCETNRLQNSLLGVESGIGLASIYEMLDRHTEALSLYRQTVVDARKLGDDGRVWVAESLNGMGSVMTDLGDYGEAERLFRESLDIRLNALGSAHQATAETLGDLGYLCLTQGRFPEAEVYYQKALTIRHSVFGSNHPTVAANLYNLAMVYRNQGRLDDAESLYWEVLRIEEKTLGRAHRNVAATRNSLGVLFWHQMRLDEAEPLFMESLTVLSEALGEHHFDLVSPLTNLGLIAWRRGEFDWAEAQLCRALTISEQVLGWDHVHVAWPVWGLANVYRDSGRFQQAHGYYQWAIAIRAAHLEPNHPDLETAKADYAQLRAIMAATGAVETGADN